MAKLLDSRVAAGILAVVVVVSILLGCGRSLMGLRADAERTFFNGVQGDGIGIASDLTALSAAAYNLTTVASRYLDGQDTRIQNVLTAWGDLTAAQEVGDKYRASQTLTREVYRLSDALKHLPLSEEDENYRQSLLTEINSRNSTMSHDGYNAQAQAFNAALGGFPANLLGPLLGVRPLELFR